MAFINCELLKLLDSFGRPVNLMFNDSDKFKTYCGAFATIIMIFFLSFAFVVSMRDVARGKLESFDDYNRVF
jgi:hypothetical protein